MSEGMNYEALATAMDNMREVLRGMVAGLVNDGFTDREARAIVTQVMGYTPPDEEEEE
jgi:hypothetical protein